MSLESYDENKAQFFEIPKEIKDDGEARRKLEVGGNATQSEIDEAYRKKEMEFAAQKKAGLEGKAPLVAENELEELKKARDFLKENTQE